MTSQQHGEQRAVSGPSPRLELSTAHQGSRPAKALPEVQIAQRFESRHAAAAVVPNLWSATRLPQRRRRVAAAQHRAATAQRGSTSIARRPRSGCMPQQELQTLFATLGAYFALLFRALARFVGEPGAVESEGEFELLALAAQRIEQAEAEADYPLGWTVEE